MDINSDNFQRTLPQVIGCIASASHVAVDLEMSGVVVVKPELQNRSLSLQAAYEEATAAAGTYQILQFGITCCKYDASKNSYLLESFNFGMTPMFNENSKLDGTMAREIDRKLTFSYKSLQFLQQHGFRIEAAFPKGITYLSRQEQREISEYFERPDGDPRQPIINLADHDTETKCYYDGVREKILHLLNQSKLDYVNVENPHGGRLNRLQKNLIYQLIYTEFKGQVRAFLKNGVFMQVVKNNAEDNTSWRRKRLVETKDAIIRQSGFRYIIEALTGGDFAKEVSQLLGIPSRGSGVTIVNTQLRRDLETHEKSLKTQRPILVGHNQFMDLCFIYNTFVQPLPAKLKDFQRDIRSLFPRLVDTKYLATRGAHEMFPDENLTELFECLENQQVPRIMSNPPLFSHHHQAAHHAGYDSWMTAVVFIKKSWMLSLDPNNLKRVPGDDSSGSEEYYTPDDGTRSRSTSPQPFDQLSLRNLALKPPALFDDRTLHKIGATYQHETSKSALPTSSKSVCSVVAMEPAPALGRRTESSGGLPEDTVDDSINLSTSESLSSAQASHPRNGSNSTTNYYPAPTSIPQTSCLLNGANMVTDESPVPARIPAWDSKFFTKFGNKVRLGTSGVVQFMQNGSG